MKLDNTNLSVEKHSTNNKQWFFNLLSTNEYDSIKSLLLRKGPSYLWDDVPCYIKVIQHYIDQNVNIECELINSGVSTTYKSLHIDDFKRLLVILKIKANILYTVNWRPHHKEILTDEFDNSFVINHDGKMMLDDTLIDYCDPTSDDLNLKSLYLHSLCIVAINNNSTHKHDLPNSKTYLEALVNEEFCISLNCKMCFPSLQSLKKDLLSYDLKRQNLLSECKQIKISAEENPFDEEVKLKHYKKKRLIKKAEVDPKTEVIKNCINKHSNANEEIVEKVGHAIYNSYGQQILREEIFNVDSSLITEEDEAMDLIDADGNLFEMSTHNICKNFLMSSNCNLVMNANFTMSDSLTDVKYGCIIMKGKTYYYENVRKRYNKYFREKYDWHFSKFMIDNLPPDFDDAYKKHFVGEYSTSDYYDIPKSFTYIQEGFC